MRRLLVYECRDLDTAHVPADRAGSAVQEKHGAAGGEAEMTERSGRYLVQRFAAHLAHLLNSGDVFIEINRFALYRTLIRTLAGPPDASGGRYRDSLLGYALVAGEREPEELAVPPVAMAD